MFRAFGHQHSSVLDGGLPEWLAEKMAVESGPPPSTPKSTYPVPKLEARLIRSECEVDSSSLKAKLAV